MGKINFIKPQQAQQSVKHMHITALVVNYGILNTSVLEIV